MPDAISYLEADLKQKERLKAKKKRRVRAIKWASVAACLFAAMSILLISIINEPNIETSKNLYYEGDTIENKKGVLTLLRIDYESQQATFCFIKETRSQQYVLMRGYCITGEYIGADGAAYYTVKNYDIISQYDWYRSDRNYEVIDDMLIIIVNGEVTNVLPKEQGTYEIIIDYSRLSEYLDYIAPIIEISGFDGWFRFDLQR